jgi:hypothetical protein
MAILGHKTIYQEAYLNSVDIWTDNNGHIVAVSGGAKVGQWSGGIVLPRGGVITGHWLG